ncbi:MAG: phage tail assembly protein T [Methyloceanibacter sp.]
MSVRQAQAEISGNEFAEWIAFMELEPFGGERGDLRAAIVASTVANANRKKGARPFRPEDFMPDFDGSRRKAKRLTDHNWRAQRAGIKAMLRAMGNTGRS